MHQETAVRTRRARADAAILPAQSGASERWRRAITRHPLASLLAAAMITAGLWFSHLPSLLLHAQFYADDGGWYQTAYADGPLASLPHPAAGYFVALQRITASLSLVLPLIAVPTFFNVVALLVEIAGICYLLSSRMAAAIPSLAARLGLAILVIALPNAYDTSGNLTNAQWHLGLLAFLVVFARAPRRLVGWAVDGCILLLSGLTGPYCIFLEPVIVLLWLRRRGDLRLRYVLTLNSLCVAAELLVIATHVGAQRANGALAAGLFPLVRMIGRQVTLGLLLGAHGLAGIIGTPLAENAVLLTLLTLVAAGICAWAAWRGPSILRAFCFFAAAELALALVAPSIPAPKWPSLGDPAGVSTFHPGGIRYFLYPLLGLAVCAAWLATRGLRRLRSRSSARAAKGSGLRRSAAVAAGAVAAVLLLVSVAVGVPADWAYPRYIDDHWSTEVQRLQAAPPGERVVIPINPPGWTFTLVSR